MIEHFFDVIGMLPIQRALIACLLCGAGCSILSVFVILMKMPLIGVAMSHAAFAGAVLGMLIGADPFISGFIVCLLLAALIGPVSDRSGMVPENMLGIFFSFTMGLAFLGLGILTRTKVTALNLMWGSLLTISNRDIYILLAVTVLPALFVLLFFKEIKSVLFHRTMARASGVPERMIYYTLLFITGAVVSANLSTVGGMLIFALIVQPAATAMQITYDLKKFFLISVASGVGSCVSGLYISYVFDWPSGASVVVCATVIFAVSFIFSPKRRDSRSRIQGV